MSLKDIADVTRIPTRSLERLEAGEFEKLPADTFVRGFLRSYAQCVGLDAEETIRRYAQCGMTPAPVSSPMANELAGSMATLDSHRASLSLWPRRMRRPDPAAADAAAPESLQGQGGGVELAASSELASVPELSGEQAGAQAPVEPQALAAQKTQTEQPAASEESPKRADKRRKRRQRKRHKENSHADMARDAAAVIPLAQASDAARAAAPQVLPVPEVPAAPQAPAMHEDAALRPVTAAPESGAQQENSEPGAITSMRSGSPAPQDSPAPPAPLDPLAPPDLGDRADGLNPSENPVQAAEQLDAIPVAIARSSSASMQQSSRPVLIIDDDRPEEAAQVQEERQAARERDENSWRSFLPPSLLDTEDGSRRGTLTLAVIILVIVATLTMSYLLRSPSSTGDGVTLLEAPAPGASQSIV